jgi:hypothetical protein
MIEVEVGEYHIGDVAGLNALRLKASQQGKRAVGFVKTKKFGGLLITQPCIDQNESLVIRNE